MDVKCWTGRRVQWDQRHSANGFSITSTASMGPICLIFELLLCEKCLSQTTYRWICDSCLKQDLKLRNHLEQSMVEALRLLGHKIVYE